MGTVLFAETFGASIYMFRLEPTPDGRGFNVNHADGIVLIHPNAPARVIAEARQRCRDYELARLCGAVAAA